MIQRSRPARAPVTGPQSGYALLLIFAMAAIVAIGLYQQLPRAAFEAQREKESLLINHGEQYKRAIQLYCRKMNRYPAKLEDLDNTQNIRFLRKHYIDPMTGKEEWRLLHMGPNGKLIDSKIEALDPNKDQWHAGSITEFKSAASSDAGGPEAINLAARKRPSDDLVLAPINGPPVANTEPGALPMGSTGGAPNAPGAPGAAGATPTTPPPPAWLNGGALPGMPPGQRGTTLPTGTPNAPPANANGANGSTSASGSSVSGNGGFGSSVSGNGGFGSTTPTPAAPNPNQAGGFAGFGGANPQQYQGQNQGQSPYPTAAGSNMPNNSGFGNPGNATSPANMINSLLTSPRPGGAPAGVGGSMGGTVVGGLAGVASTHKGHGIKRYGDQDEYQKWEFYYDFNAEVTGATTGNNAANQQNQNQGPSQAQPGGTFGGTNGSFGTAAPPPVPPPAPPVPATPPVSQ